MNTIRARAIVGRIASAACGVVAVLFGCAPVVSTSHMALGPSDPWEVVATRSIPSIVEVYTEGFAYRGTGFVAGKCETIVTANHILTSDNAYQVRFSDGSAREATVESRGLGDDIAVLRLDHPHAPPLPLWSGSFAPMGTAAMLIGNQSGRQYLATWGRVATVDPAYEYIAPPGEWVRTIYFDGDAHPGSSGAPWLTIDGMVIAVNLGGFPSPRNGHQYAGPSSRISDRLAGVARVRPTLGSQLRDSGMETRGDQVAAPLGAIIHLPAPDGPLAIAGGRARDVIVGVNGVRTHCIDSVLSAIERLRPDDTVRVSVWRHDSAETEELAVKLGPAH